MLYQPKATTVQDQLVSFLQAESTAGRISPPIQSFVFYFDPEVIAGWPSVLMITESEAPNESRNGGIKRQKVASEFTVRVMVIWPNLQEAQKVLRRTTWQVIHAINRATNLQGHPKWVRTRYHVRRHDDKPLFTADITYEVDYTETFTEDIEA